MKGPLYLARRSYRTRRTRDAARFLPLLGAILMIVPILWGPGETGAVCPALPTEQGSVESRTGRSLGADALYIFALWTLLIAAALWLSRTLHDGPDDPAGAPGDDG